MYSKELQDRLINLLAPEGFDERGDSESRYPARGLPSSAEVTRVPPSPTGLVHIGTIYAGLINMYIARQSGGVFILRIEDTDKNREVEGAVNQIIDNFHAFDIDFNEGPVVGGEYGPYQQSERGAIYLGYAVDLLRKGRAYPCFATSEELQTAVQDQQAKKLRPGYYGDWALWRDKPETEINQALDEKRPFVLRFRSEGSHESRITLHDELKGQVELPQNDLDVPLIKSDEHHLPTYHLAHVVDDFLMRTTLVVRGDEWLPSTPLHVELAEALSIPPFRYAHLAPISVIDKNGGKRKLSKRKDEEADVRYWVDAGYPVQAVKAYLLGLANSNFEEWYRANPEVPLSEFSLSLEKLAASRAPLLDMRKLEDYCKDYIARLPQEEFMDGIMTAADDNFSAALQADPDYTKKVLSIERDGDKPRKDLARWGDAPDLYGYFFDELFKNNFQRHGREELLSDLDEQTISSTTQQFLSSYDADDSQEAWLEKMRADAASLGLHMRDYARILRVLLTGKNRTPDLYTIMRVMGRDRVLQRLK